MIKILSYFAHSIYQNNLSKIPNTEFYHIVDENFSQVWDDQVLKPGNVFEISKKEALDRQKEFDLLLLHRHPTILSSYEEGFRLIPRVFVEHTHPFNDYNITTWKENRSKYIDHTVFITKSNLQAWGMQEDEKNSVIYHAIDLKEFPEYIGGEKFVMTTCNEFPGRDWCCGYLLWSKSTWGILDVRVYGYGNRNIGEADKGKMPNNEIIKLLIKCGVYFNPTLASPIPMALLEALACGTPVVSTHNCEMKHILQDNVNSFVANDAPTLRKKIIEMLENPERAKKIGLRGKEVVKNTFPPEKFIYKWKKIFERFVK